MQQDPLTQNVLQASVSFCQLEYTVSFAPSTVAVL